MYFADAVVLATNRQPAPLLLGYPVPEKKLLQSSQLVSIPEAESMRRTHSCRPRVQHLAPELYKGQSRGTVAYLASADAPFLLFNSDTMRYRWGSTCNDSVHIWTGLKSQTVGASGLSQATCQF